MFCSKCGNQLPEGAVVCPKCGEKTEREPSFSDVTNYAEKKAQQVAAGFQNKAQSLQESYQERKEERKIKDIRDMFVNPDEEKRAVIGGNYLDNLLITGILSKGFGVLTNRRLYYRGKCYYKSGGHYVKSDEECTIDVQDITSSGFVYTRQLIFIWLAVCAFLGSVFFWINTMISNFMGYKRDAGTANSWAVACLVLTILLIALYVFFRTAMYEVTFAGGSIAIKASSYSVQEVKKFDKTLRMTKDEYLRNMS